MAKKPKTRTGTTSPTYGISAVRKGPGRDEYFVTIMRDGKPAGEVKVRAPSRAPGYFSDKKKFEIAS